MVPTRRTFLALAFSSPALPAELPIAGPARMLSNFYRWYLGSLNENRDPIQFERDRLQKFLAPSLMAELDRLRKKPGGLDTDYFLQTQDFLPDWKTNFTVGNPVPVGAASTLIVTFGLKGRETYRVIVSMKNSGAEWKILKVKRLSR